MTYKISTGAGLLALGAAMLADPWSSAGAAGLAANRKAPYGLEISERATERRTLTADLTPVLRVHDGQPVEWTVSATGQAEALPAAEFPSTTSIASRLRLDVAALDLSWVCTVQVPRGGAEPAAHGESVIHVGMPIGDIIPGSRRAMPSSVELEWAGSGEMSGRNLGLPVVRGMVGGGKGAHAGRLEGRMHWRDGTSLTAGRAWSGAGSEGGARSGFGLRRNFSGEGWELGAGVDVGLADGGHAATDSLVLDASGRIVALPGAATVTMAARYEQRPGADQGQESLAIEFGADLTEMISTHLPWVSEPRFRMQASARAAARERRTRPLRLQEVRGTIEVGWRF